MNNDFCSIGETLKANVPHQLNSLLAGKYIVNPNNQIFNFEDITEELVFSTCNHMKTSFGYGLFHLDLKYCGDIKTLSVLNDKNSQE